GAGHGVSGDDDHGGGVSAHGAVAPAEATKRPTSLIGTASARPPVIMVLMPTTRPAASASGPPEFPGASRTSAWIHRRPPRTNGAMAWTTPAVSVRRRPRGGAGATTTAPTRTSAQTGAPAGTAPAPGTR